MADPIGAEQQPRKQPEGARWALILIALGVILLIINLGWFSWGLLLSILQAWPVALIAVGVDMLLKGRHRLLVIGAAVVAALLLYAIGGFSLGGGGSTVPVAQELQGATRAQVRLSPGVATLRITGAPGSGMLASGSLETRRGERIKESFSVRGNTAHFGLESAGRIGFFGGSAGGRTWELALTEAVPIDLKVDSGVGDANLDLTDVRLEALDLDAGVGNVTITLPRSGQYTASVDAGVGNMTVRLPRGLAARIDVSSGIGRVRVPGGFTRSGDRYTSANFEGAANRVELRLSGGVGDVNIEQVD